MICLGLFVASGALSQTVALYVPGARLPVVAPSCRVSGAVVPVRVPLSQPLAPAAYEMESIVTPLSALPPPLLIATV